MLTRGGFRLAVLALALAGGHAGGAPAPERWLAADALAFVAVPNWDAAAAALRQNAFSQLWADPAMRSFAGSFQARFRKEVIGPIEKELALDLAKYIGLFHGAVALACTPTPADGLPGRSAGFLLVADTGTNSAQLAALLEVWRKRRTEAGRPLKPIRLRELEFSVVTLNLSEVTRAFDRLLPDPEAGRGGTSATAAQAGKAEWTIGQMGSWLVVSDSAREVDKLLALRGTNAPPSLADSAVYAADAAQFQDLHAYAWINLKASLAQTASGGAGEAGLLAQMSRALGLGGLQTAALALQESAAGTLATLRLKVPEAERKGLFRVLSLAARDASPPAFVPADVVKFTRARLDLPQAWGHFEAMLGDASPAAAGFLKFVLNTAGKDKDAAFDLREKLIARLGDDLISFEKAPRADGAGQDESERSLVLVGARNPELAVEAMNALPSLLPPETTRRKQREFLGRTIHSVTLPRKEADGSLATGAAWFYTAGGAHVALSSDLSMIEEYLRGSDGVARPLRSRPALLEAAQRVGGLGIGFFSYHNTSEAARIFFDSARKASFNAASLLGALKLGSQLGLTREGGLLSWGDYFLLPPYERVAKYFHLEVSACGLEAGGYTYRCFLPTPPGLRK